jgi:FRG domain
MDSANPSIKIIDAATASEFWNLLSPERPLFPGPCDLLYRGHADHRWNLTPVILRREISSRSDMQVFKEWAYIDEFVRHCDSIGLPIPNDSPAFREGFLNQNSPAGPGKAFTNTSAWPPPELYALLALGHHYRLPTRLLDWSTRSYVAAYFAISDVLAGGADDGADRLAVWVLDIEQKALFPKLKVVKVPGSNNMNLAAQAGLFTLLEQQGIRGAPFEGGTSLDLYMVGQPLPPPLLKVTLPITEASAALKLCSLHGVTGATLFPDYSGAARAAEDIMRNAIRV